MKGFLKEFHEFISRGDVMSMAVGIIIGGAFTAIINSIVTDIIGPVIGAVCGGVDFASAGITIGEAHIGLGNFIQAVINFLITALVLFLIMRSFNRFKDRAGKLMKKEEEKAAEPEVPEDVRLLTEIRDLMKKQ
jgi:large conductance mechanosensitive channel